MGNSSVLRDQQKRLLLVIVLPSLSSKSTFISLMQFELSIGKKVATLPLYSLPELGSALSRRTSMVACVDLSLLAMRGCTGIIIRKKL